MLIIASDSTAANNNNNNNLYLCFNPWDLYPQGYKNNNNNINK